MSQEEILDKDYIEELEADLLDGQAEKHRETLAEVHFADLAEILNTLNFDAGLVLLDDLPNERAAEILMELTDDERAKFLEHFSGKTIANDFINNLDSDDAADLINELDDQRKKEVLNFLEDSEQARELASLLVYPEGTAGALMATELIKVNHNWRVLECVKQMRRQAENIEQIHAIYVVDDQDKLLGTLSLKKLLTTSTRSPISEAYDHRVKSVVATTEAEEVANDMQKYDLVVMPVVDAVGHLVGRITIDDVVDFIREEAKEDYNLASGLTDEVETSDNVFRITRARLPWLMIGLFGGIMAASVIGRYEADLAEIPKMAFFIPLIAAMGGNVGVQSSAIIVQGLANQTIDGSLIKRLLKELGVALLNGSILALLIAGAGLLLGYSLELSLTVSVALFAVIIASALVGTFVPLGLHKYNVDPALATGPFITTMNDILGLFIYFSIGRVILG